MGQTAPDQSSSDHGQGFTSLAAGFFHTCGLLDGTATCRGQDWMGQLGDGVAGENRGTLAPVEVENTLMGHPAILETAVVGHADTDELIKPKAFVVLKPGETATAEEIVEFCRLHLAPFKVPRKVEFRAELPRHPTGKLYKRLLKDEYWAGHTSSIV